LFPMYNTTLAYSNANFSCYASDNVELTSISLYVYDLNGVIYKDTMLPASPSYNALFNTTLADGRYYWNCGACDTSDNCLDGDKQIFTVDTSPPAVSFEQPTPQNASRNVGNEVSVNISLIDRFSNIGSCILSWNDINETMSMAGGGRNGFCFITKPTGDGMTYAFSVFASDSVGNVVETDTRVIKENNKPSFASASYQPPVSSKNSSIDVLFSGVVDYDGDQTGVWCTDLKNESLCHSEGSMQDEQSCTFSPPWNISGTYQIYCELNDSYETSNTLAIRLAFDNTPPNVSLITPANNSKLTFWFQNFGCKASDNYALANVSLVVNNFPVETSSWGYNGTYYFQMNSTEGSWLWTCLAVDRQGHSMQPPSRRISVDLYDPKVEITYPLNNSNLSTNPAYFGIKASDTNLFNVTFVSNFSGKWRILTNLKASRRQIEANVSYNFSKLGGYYAYYVVACDSFGKCVKTNTRFAFKQVSNNSLIHVNSTRMSQQPLRGL